MANQERTKILEMVASGKLSIEQADHALEMLGTQNVDEEKRLAKSVLPEGLTNLTREELAALEDHEVDAAYIRALQEAGLTNLTVKQLITLKDNELDPAYVKAMLDMDLTNLTVKQLISLQDNDVE